MAVTFRMEQTSFTRRTPLDLPDLFRILGAEPIQVSNWLMKIPKPSGCSDPGASRFNQQTRSQMSRGDAGSVAASWRCPFIRLCLLCLAASAPCLVCLPSEQNAITQLPGGLLSFFSPPLPLFKDYLMVPLDSSPGGVTPGWQPPLPPFFFCRGLKWSNSGDLTPPPLRANVSHAAHMDLGVLPPHKLRSILAVPLLFFFSLCMGCGVPPRWLSLTWLCAACVASIVSSDASSALPRRAYWT